MIADALLGAHLLRELPAFLRRPLDLAEARAIVRQRLAHRGTDFLTLVRREIYGNPRSPYRPLLAHAACEYRDLEHLVQTDGLEDALATLTRAGVYLTVDELKGRQPIVRGTLRLDFDPRQLWNPRGAGHLLGQSSGSRGPRATVPIDLASVRDLSVDLRVFLDALGGRDVEHAIWMVPGGWPLDNLLRFRACGVRVARWFSQVDPAAPGLHPRYRWSARVLRWATALTSGAPLPAPERVPVDDPAPVVRWMVETLAQGRTPHLWTFASSAVRVCQAAGAAGVALAGARFTVSGEPVTATRLAVIQAVGGYAVPRYGSIECGQIGLGCLAPEAPDELHLLTDHHAVIATSDDPPWRPGTLLFSSLRPAARMILLNVSLGDEAIVDQRQCGCPMETAGWTTHLRRIRSQQKVTAGGMNVLNSQLARVLDEVLPGRFGGMATNYQLLEEEATDGRPRLRLLVDPLVGPVDEAAVVRTLLAAVGPGSGVDRVTALSWQDAELVVVERRAPVTTASGKILHRHVERGQTRSMPVRSLDAD